MNQVRSMVNGLVAGNLSHDEFKAKYTSDEYNALTEGVYGNAVAEGLRRHHEQLATLPEERIKLLRETIPLFKKGSGAYRRASTTYAQGTNKYTRPEYKLWIRDNLGTGDELHIQTDKEWTRRRKRTYRLGSEGRRQEPARDTPEREVSKDENDELAPRRQRISVDEEGNSLNESLERTRGEILHIASQGQKQGEVSPLEKETANNTEILHKAHGLGLITSPPRTRKNRSSRQRKDVRFAPERSRETKDSRTDSELGVEDASERSFPMLDELRQKSIALTDSFPSASHERKQTMAAIRAVKDRGVLLVEGLSEFLEHIRDLELTVKPGQQVTGQEHDRILRATVLLQGELRELGNQLQYYRQSVDKLQFTDAMDQLADRAKALARERESIYQQVLGKEYSQEYLKSISPDIGRARDTSEQVIEAQRLRDSLQSGLIGNLDNFLLLKNSISERIARLHQEILDMTKEASIEGGLDPTSSLSIQQDQTRVQEIQDAQKLLKRLSLVGLQSGRPPQRTVDNDNDGSNDKHNPVPEHITAEELEEEATTWTTLLYFIESELEGVTRLLREAKVEGEELKSKYATFLAHGWHSELISSLPPIMDPAQHRRLLLEKLKPMQSQLKENMEHLTSYGRVVMAVLKFAKDEGFDPHLNDLISRWVTSVRQHFLNLSDHHSHEELLESLERVDQQRQDIIRLWEERLRLVEDVRSLWNILDTAGGQANLLFERLTESVDSQLQQQPQESRLSEDQDPSEGLQEWSVPFPGGTSVESGIKENETGRIWPTETAGPEEPFSIKDNEKREEQEVSKSRSLTAPSPRSALIKRDFRDQQQIAETEAAAIGRAEKRINELISALSHLSSQMTEAEKMMKKAGTEGGALKTKLIDLTRRARSRLYRLSVTHQEGNDEPGHRDAANEIFEMKDQLKGLMEGLRAFEENFNNLPSISSRIITGSPLDTGANGIIQAIVKEGLLKGLPPSQDQTKLEVKIQEAQRLDSHLAQAQEPYRLLYKRLLSLQEELRALASQAPKLIDQAQAQLLEIESQRDSGEEVLTEREATIIPSQQEFSKQFLETEEETRRQSREHLKSRADSESLLQEEKEEISPLSGQTVSREQTEEIMSRESIVDETPSHPTTGEILEEKSDANEVGDEIEEQDQDELLKKRTSTRELEQPTNVREEEILKSPNKDEPTDLATAETLGDVEGEVKDENYGSGGERQGQGDKKVILKRDGTSRERLVPDSGIQGGRGRIQDKDGADESDFFEEANLSKPESTLINILDASLSQKGSEPEPEPELELELETETETEPDLEPNLTVKVTTTSEKDSPSSTQKEEGRDRERELSRPEQVDNSLEEKRNHKSALPDLADLGLENEGGKSDAKEIGSYTNKLETESESDFSSKNKESIQETEPSESKGQEEHFSSGETSDEGEPPRNFKETVSLPVSEEILRKRRKYLQTEDLVPPSRHTRKIAKQNLFSELDQMLTRVHKKKSMVPRHDSFIKTGGKSKIRARKDKGRHKVIPQRMRSWRKVIKKPLRDEPLKVVSSGDGRQKKTLKSVPEHKVRPSTKVPPLPMKTLPLPRSKSLEKKQITEAPLPPLSTKPEASQNTTLKGSTSSPTWNLGQSSGTSLPSNVNGENGPPSPSLRHTTPRPERRQLKRKKSALLTKETVIVRNVLPISNEAGKRIFAHLSPEEKKQISVIDPKTLTLAEFRQLPDRIARELPPVYIRKLRFKHELEAGDVARMNNLAFSEFILDDIRQLKDLNMLRPSQWKHLGENIAEGPFHPGKAVTEELLRSIPLSACSSTLVGQIPMTSFGNLTELQLQQLDLSHLNYYQISAIPRSALRVISKEKAQQMGSSIKKTLRLHPRYGMTISRWSALPQPAREEVYKLWYSSSAYELGRTWFGLGIMGWTIRPFIFMW